MRNTGHEFPHFNKFSVFLTLEFEVSTMLAGKRSQSLKPNAMMYFNLLKPSGDFTYYQAYLQSILHGAHIAFMCFVRISEQTATFT
jgi:hypothetical protein